MLFKVLIIAVMLECIAADSRLGAEKGYKLEYFFKANWYNANLFCRYHDLQLATVQTNEQQEYVQNLIAGVGLKQEYFWTSGSDLAQDGSWSWYSTGNKVGYSSWAAGEPNNAGKNEHCLHIYQNQKWNDAPCGNLYYFICESPKCVTCY